MFRECYICGRTTQLQMHHMLHGSMREQADRLGLTCDLCLCCQQKLHDKGEYDKFIQRAGQRKFEETRTRKEFMEIFGKNYLGDEPEQSKEKPKTKWINGIPEGLYF